MHSEHDANLELEPLRPTWREPARRQHETGNRFRLPWGYLLMVAGCGLSFWILCNLSQV